MAKKRACKICNTIYDEKDKCPNCDSKEYTESFKGRILVLNPEKSEIAKRIKINKMGDYAIKTK